MAVQDVTVSNITKIMMSSYAGLSANGSIFAEATIAKLITSKVL
jgi:hypothetical protein